MRGKKKKDTQHLQTTYNEVMFFQLLGEKEFYDKTNQP